MPLSSSYWAFRYHHTQPLTVISYHFRIFLITEPRSQVLTFHLLTVYVRAGAHRPQCAGGGQRTTLGSRFSHSSRESGDGAQIVRLGGQVHYPLSPSRQPQSTTSMMSINVSPRTLQTAEMLILFLLTNQFSNSAIRFNSDCYASLGRLKGSEPELSSALSSDAGSK